MLSRFFTFLIINILLLINGTYSQSGAETYVWPTDKLVLQNLKKWQGYKFGVLIHFGLYSKLGTVESWGLCPEDWVTRDGYDNYCKYADDYRNTRFNFNPEKFNPVKWAKAIAGAGAKYLIFTTKHHDGFCMFDSRFTDFKVSDRSCPFYYNTGSNIAKEVFEAGRGEGLAIGAYFSKPDWTTPFFWWPNYPPKDRNPNYDITKYPERWKRYVGYTQSQLAELTSYYGKIDILWLDGCWVRPLSTINKQVEEFCKYPYDLDIDMKTVAANARSKQPGMLIVDRWVQGPYEDYLTPEQKTPDKALEVPWESCISLGNAWGWVPNDHYKTGKEVIQLLVKIVAKGGNLLLGIGPDGSGEFDSVVYQRLSEVGQWLHVNGEAIYETSPVAPYQEGKIAYTAKNENVIYAFYLPDKEENQLPDQLLIKTTLKGNLQVSVIPEAKPLSYTPVSGGIRVQLPPGLRKKRNGDPALVIKISNK